MYIGLYVKCPLFFSDFTETFIFLTDFQKNNEISNFMKICPLGAEVFSVRVDGQTVMTKLIVAFRSFANSLKNETQNTNFVDTVWT